MTVTVLRALVAGAVLLASPAFGQMPDLDSTPNVWPMEGWRGFADFGFLAHALSTLVLAAVLGLAIGYHPRRLQAADTLEEIQAPKVYTMYAVIGAIIGIMVLKYGLVVGFVVFGIGGLIRFRTDLRSPNLTGYVIFATLIGLSSGLNLPHVAVLAAGFGYVLIYILERRTTYHIDVKGLPPVRIAESAAVYRELLEQHGCRIVSEKKSPGKAAISFIFDSPRSVTQRDLDGLFETKIDRELRGAVDWEVD